MDSNVLAGVAVAGVAIIGAVFFLKSDSKNKDSKVVGGGGASDQKLAPPAAPGNSSAPSSAPNKYPLGKLSIYFGSQTGTAEGYSRTLMEEGKAKGFDAKVIDLVDFNPAALAASSLCIFVIATYGEGEPTDNATKFSAWLNDTNTSHSFLKDVNFTVFGLGNKQYTHFNKMAKDTNAALERLGAKRVAAYGEGDDDGSLEEDFERWKEAMWESLIQNGSSGKSVPVSASSEKSKVDLEFRVVPSTTSKLANFSPSEVNNSTKHYFNFGEGIVRVNRELRSSKGAGSTRHIEMDIAPGTQYITADNLAILPENNAAYVEQLCRLLGYDLDMCFKLEPIDKGGFKHPFPTPCNVRQALTCYYDIQGFVRHNILAKFVPYVNDQVQKEWLKELLSKDKLANYKKRIEDEKITIVDLLSSKLSSCRVPLEDFLHIVPHLQPRYYTISSSSSVHPRSVHMTISITEEDLKATKDSSSIRTSGKRFVGVCSDYMQHFRLNSPCRIFIKASSFRLPTDNSLPIIMVGPGTGIAPMRALLQEREYRASSGQKVGMNVLFFGCRHQSEDYIYRDELEGFQQRKVLNELHLAFSRDQSERIYVQTLMNKPEVSASIMRYIDQGGYIYVCGATSMGNDVHQTLVRIVEREKQGGIGKVAAEAFVKQLKDSHRYVQELWS